MSVLVERLITARDRLRTVEVYAGGEFCPVREARTVMADAANFHAEAERRIKELEGWWYAVPEEQRFGIMSDAAWKRHEAAAPQGTSTAKADALQAFMAEVAKEFGGKLPGDAWHLYVAKGLSPDEAAAEHRRIVGSLAINGGIG